MTTHAQSSLELGISVIENNVDIYDPVRFIDVTDPIAKLCLKIEKRPDEIDEEDYLFVDYVAHAIANTGSYQLSPFSFNWNHLHRIYTVLKHFQKFTRNIPLSSCRLDEIARDPGLAELIAHFSGSTNITSAVEGISERICDALEKSLSTEEFICGMEALIKAGFNGIKIYYIYTGMETAADVKEFEHRLDIINQLKHKHNSNVNVRTSFTPLHSTLGTPTAYHGSKVAKSLKSGDRVFRAIRAACSQHNIIIRLSAALGSVDVGQMMSMSDRRAQTWIEYLGLNGVRPGKPNRVVLYAPEGELDEVTYMKTPRTDRVKIAQDDGTTKYFLAPNTWNFSTERLYRDINENWMYPKLTAAQIEQSIVKFAKDNPDGRVPELILDHMQPSNTEKFKWPKGFMHVSQADNPYTVGYTDAQPGSPAQAINTLYTERSIDESEAEDIKRMFAYLSGGVTFNDMIEDKSALHVLPDAHMLIAPSRHPGWAFSKYIGAFRANLASTYCHSASLAACNSCGQCTSQVQIRSVSAPRASMETGAKYLASALEEHKNYEVAHRLLAAIQISDGYYAAMYPQFIRHGLNRALLKGSLTKWVKPFIYDKTWNSRIPYSFRETHGRSAISGQILFELSMNYDFDAHRQVDIDAIVENAKRFVGKGWQIERLTRLPDPTTPLTNYYDTVIIQYLIDTREADVTKDQLLKLAERLKTKRVQPFNVMTHRASGRDSVRIVERELPVKAIKGVFITRTMSPHHISMSVVLQATDVHPQSLLACLINRAIDSRDDDVGQTARVQAHTTRILGHYKSSDVKQSLIPDKQGSSITCPYTGEIKLINIITGEPFGAAQYEQLEAYPGAGQSIFLTNANTQAAQWWPTEPAKVSL